MNGIGNLDNGVIYAVFGILTMTVAAIIWMVKYFATTLSKDLREHTKAASRQVQASKEATNAAKQTTKISGEMLVFMKNLNGKLGTITKQTIKEQQVEHQIVKEVK